MKLSIRLTTLAITTVAFAGVLGAQRQSSSHSAARAQARPQAHAGARPQPRQQMAMRGPTEHFARESMTPRYAPQRADARVRNGVQARSEFRGRNDVQVRNEFRGRNDVQVRNDFRGRGDYRAVPVAANLRPLITRASVQGRVYGGSQAYGTARFGSRGFVPRIGLPLGWEGRVVFHGFFPPSYASYCDAVPVGYNYLLPPMIPSYDPCMFGDRVIVFDRFSRSIVFVAEI